MQSKTMRVILGLLIAVILLTGVFSAGILVGWFLPGNLPGLMGKITQTPAAVTSETDTDTLFEPFWETWDIIHDQYVDQPVDDVALMRGAIRGALEALGDEHTGYMDPSQYSQANIDLGGEYSGIGAWVDATGEYLTILSPMPDSPAEKAGLKPLDEIIKIDGEDMTGIPGDVAIKKVLGPADTRVVLTIRRKDVTEPFDVEVIRAKINVPSVEGKMLDNNVAYVQIYTFGEQTADELHKTLQELLQQNPVGLVVDLRNNGGGLLTTAISVSSEFLEKNVLMYEVYGDGKRDVIETRHGGIATEIPLVVLTNKFSASASEILAGAIQDYGRGKLVGETTYGKGSVQNWIELKNEQGAVRVTIARWLTPKERQINKEGIKPDIEVALTEEDYNANRDPQLDAAVNYLLGK